MLKGCGESIKAIQSDIENNLEASKEIATLSEETVDRVGTLDTISNELLSLLAHILESSSESRGLAENLHRSVDEIASVITLIKDISDQTKSFSTQSLPWRKFARAGEHGRGFAVVADEVRD